MRKLLVRLGLLVFAGHAAGATCTFNAATGAWSDPAHWDGCATGNGDPAGTPGAADHAIVANATITIGGGGIVPIHIQRLDLGSGAVLKNGAAQFVEIIPGLLLNLDGGSIRRDTSAGGTIDLTIPAGASAVLNAPTTFLGSNFRVSGTLTLAAPAPNRIELAGGSSLNVLTGGTLLISGDAEIRRSSEAGFNGDATLVTDGNLLINGPGTVALNGAGAGQRLNVSLRSGVANVVNATLSKGGNAMLGALSPPPGSTLAIVLDTGTIDMGAIGNVFGVPKRAMLRGHGNINGGLSVTGLLDPGAISAAPFGTINVSGAMQVQSGATFAIDAGGLAAGQHDALVIAGTLDGLSDTTGKLELRFVPGFAPALGSIFPIATYANTPITSAFRNVVAPAGRYAAPRFGSTELSVALVPRLLLPAFSAIEGNSGSAVVQVPVRLSEPSPLPITVYIWSTAYVPVTAISGGANADFVPVPNTLLEFAPGQTERLLPVTIRGDTTLEGDEAFVLTVERSRSTNVAVAADVFDRPILPVTILTDDLAPDTRFVLVAGNGVVRRYTSAGVLVDSWDIGDSAAPSSTTGLCFGPGGEILATRFDTSLPSGLHLLNRAGGTLRYLFGDDSESLSGTNRAESCVFDRSGNVYVGHAGVSGSPEAEVALTKYDSAGRALGVITVPTGTRGTDWIDLGADQCTLYYSSEDDRVRRFDVCTQTVLPDLAAGLAAPCFALRRRPNGEMMVACRSQVYRLDANGAVVQTYSAASIGETAVNGLFALNLDPDGSSFWTAGPAKVYRVEIATGAVLHSFTSAATAIGGLAVYDEIFGVDQPWMFRDGFE